MSLSNRDFRLTLTGTYSGQQIVNVFYYQKATTGVVGDANRLNAAFQEDVLPRILAISNTFVTYQNITVVNLALMEDFDSDSPQGLVGEVTTGQPGSKFVAYGFRYHRTTRLGRDGSKRFAGTAEDLLDGSGLTYTGALTTAIPGLFGALGAGISALGADFNPMIPHRELVQYPTPPMERYELMSLFSCSNVTYSGLTTQNSRKR